MPDLAPEARDGEQIDALRPQCSWVLQDSAKLDLSAAKGIKEYIVMEKGFFILPSQFFGKVRTRAREDADLNETLAAIFKSFQSEHKAPTLLKDTQPMAA